MGKTRDNKKHSLDFKISVIMDMRENQMSYKETQGKYNLSCDKMVARWERIYLEEGIEGLMKERRGRARKLDNINKGVPPKLDKQVEEDLIAENQRLRMELDYLKKLSTLVLAEERKSGKKRS